MTPHAADVDGDGDLDVLVPDNGSRPFLILNQGGVLVPSPAPLPVVAAGNSSFFADIDGDGDPDIFASDGRTLLQNQGNGTFVDVTATTAFPGPDGPVLACFDVDGDGDLDLITATVILLNNGTVFTAQPATVNLLFGYNLGSAAADFDGDGDIDLPGLPNFLRQVHAPAAPIRGNAYSLEVHTRPGASSLVVAAGALGSALLPMGSLGILRLDPASMLVLHVQNVSTGPLTLTWTLPGNPALTACS